MSAQEGLVPSMPSVVMSDDTPFMTTAGVLRDLSARITSLESELAGLRETLRLNSVWDFPRDLQNLSVKLDEARAENARLLAVNATLREALKDIQKEAMAIRPPRYSWFFDRSQTALAGHEQAGAKGPVLGGTEFCGHSMMRAICPTCSPPTITAEQMREAVSSTEYQQRRGAAWDIIDEALNSYREFMLDDDFDSQSALDKIMARIDERRSLYRPASPGKGGGA